MGLVPGDTVGIIGGGQLGRMLAMSAARLGLKTIVLDPAENAPAFQCANEAICAPFDDPRALSDLAARSKVITYEFENVDLNAIRALESAAPCRPNPRSLEVSQDRLVEKQFFNSLGVPTAPFVDLPDAQSLAAAVAELGGGIVKTRRFGYDGKGQIRIKGSGAEDLSEASILVEKQPCILEGLVEFEREVSIIAARSVSGEFASFEIAENVHKDGILHTSTLPANASDGVRSQAKEIAVKVLNELDYVGVMGIEFFVMSDDTLIANEYAPRVHNSGHWTEAACAISQFEQHIRAVAGLPLGDTSRHSDCVMENLIGNDVDRVADIQKMANTMLHLYGKADVRAGRKMGHFTTLV